MTMMADLERAYSVIQDAKKPTKELDPVTYCFLLVNSGKVLFIIDTH